MDILNFKFKDILMKYFDWKIKKEHHILKEFEKVLYEIAKIPEVQKIIPWRIKRQQKWTGGLKLTFSYYTNSGLKFLMKKWSTVQELFIVCKEEYKEKIKKTIKNLDFEFK